MKKTLSMILAIMMVLTSVSCLSVVSFAADELAYEAEVESNDTNVTAQNMVVAKTYKGSLQVVSDTDWYVFENTEDYFEVTMACDPLTDSKKAGCGWDVKIYTENDLVNPVSTVDEVVSAYTFPKLPYSGKIYVKVDSYIDAFDTAPAQDAYYNLSVNTTEDALWESEDNSTTVDANEIAVDSIYVGALQKSTDVDWYVFENTENYFEVTMSCDLLTDSEKAGCGWDVKIYTENDLINPVSTVDEVVSAYTFPKLPYLGKIYIKVNSYIDAFDTAPTQDAYYNLSVNTTADDLWESEDNSTTLDANEIAVDSIYVGALQKSTDVDWYVFENTEDYFEVTMSCDLLTDSEKIGCGWDVKIYTGNDLINPVSTKDEITSSYITPKLPYSGKIYIKVDSYIDAFDTAPTQDAYYNLTVNTTKDALWESEYNTINSQANRIIEDSVYSAALQNETDVDWYVFDSVGEYFELTFKRDDNIDIGSVGSGWDVRIYTANDLNTPVAVQEEITASYTFPKVEYKGKIYVKVDTYIDAFDTAPTQDAYYKFSVKTIPTTPKVATTNEIGGVQVKWNAVAGATKYVVFRRQGGYNTWVNVGTTTGTTLLDKNVKSGIYYVYSVRAYNNKGEYSDFVQANTQTRKFMATPKLTGISNATNGLYIKWNAVAGITEGYRVYRRGAGSTYWTYLGTTKNLYFTDTQVKNKSGEYFRYTVIADGGYHSKFDTTGLYLKRLANPTLSSAVSSKSGITVKWGAVKGTTGYNVYRKTANSNWVRVATVSGTNATTYLDKTAKKGTTYTYTVRGVCGKYISSYNSGISCKDKY